MRRHTSISSKIITFPSHPAKCVTHCVRCSGDIYAIYRTLTFNRKSSVPSTHLIWFLFWFEARSRSFTTHHLSSDGTQPHQQINDAGATVPLHALHWFAWPCLPCISYISLFCSDEMTLRISTNRLQFVFNMKQARKVHRIRPEEMFCCRTAIHLSLHSNRTYAHTYTSIPARPMHKFNSQQFVLLCVGLCGAFIHSCISYHIYIYICNWVGSGQGQSVYGHRNKTNKQIRRRTKQIQQQQKSYSEPISDIICAYTYAANGRYLKSHDDYWVSLRPILSAQFFFLYFARSIYLPSKKRAEPRKSAIKRNLYKNEKKDNNNSNSTTETKAKCPRRDATKRERHESHSEKSIVPDRSYKTATVPSICA